MLIKQLLKNKDVEARSWDRKNLVWGRGIYEGRVAVLLWKLRTYMKCGNGKMNIFSELFLLGSILIVVV